MFSFWETASLDISKAIGFQYAVRNFKLHYVWYRILWKSYEIQLRKTKYRKYQNHATKTTVRKRATEMAWTKSNFTYTLGSVALTHFTMIIYFLHNSLGQKYRNKMHSGILLQIIPHSLAKTKSSICTMITEHFFFSYSTLQCMYIFFLLPAFGTFIKSFRLRIKSLLSIKII